MVKFINLNSELTKICVGQTDYKPETRSIDHGSPIRNNNP
jgi:hypothetical protein